MTDHICWNNILLEQLFLMFINYLPLLSEICKSCYLRCKNSLIRVLIAIKLHQMIYLALLSNFSLYPFFITIMSSTSDSWQKLAIKCKSWFFHPLMSIKWIVTKVTSGSYKLMFCLLVVWTASVFFFQNNELMSDRWQLDFKVLYFFVLWLNGRNPNLISRWFFLLPFISSWRSLALYVSAN